MQRISLIFCAVIVLAFIVVAEFQKHTVVTAGKIDERLAELREPFISVTMIGYEHPNMIGIGILDATSRYREFAIQYEPTNSSDNPIVIVGGPSNPDNPLAHADNPKQTKDKLVYILKSYSHGDTGMDRAVAILTKRADARFIYAYDRVRDFLRPAPEP